VWADDRGTVAFDPASRHVQSSPAWRLCLDTLSARSARSGPSGTELLLPGRLGGLGGTWNICTVYVHAL